MNGQDIVMITSGCNKKETKAELTWGRNAPGKGQV